MEKLNSLEEICRKILPADGKIMNELYRVWNNKCIPLGSLGWLSQTFIQIGGIQRTLHPNIEKKLTLVMAADNGVVEEGVSQSDYHVTTQVVENMVRKKASISIMSQYGGSDYLVVDMGMKEPVAGTIDLAGVRETNNMVKGPAMTRQAALAAVLAGTELAMEKAAEGYGLFSTGEMGIGNTTTSAAMVAVFSGKEPEMVTGRGAGLSTEGLKRKIQVIKEAIALNSPDQEDPIDVLAKVGGLDIAGLTGVFLGGAAAGIPVVIDGFFASVAALTAYKICPASRDVMIASHCSKEPGAALTLEMLGLKPIIFGEFHLGEGSGAILLFPMLDQVFNLYEKLPSFEEGQIETYLPLK